MYVTYAIRDPRTGKYVYVGQTSDFPGRQKSHSRKRKRRPALKTSSIRTWLFDLLTEGLIPEFEALESVEDEAASLESETRWVGILTEQGHPLLNRWREHRQIVQQGQKHNLPSRWPGKGV